jgi:Ig-like domain from next to BRCA1 gene/Bacterial Ig domain
MKSATITRARCAVLCATLRATLYTIICSLLVTACRIGGDPSEPVSVVISSPANNAMVPLGRPAQIVVSAAAQAGVSLVELSVNGTLIAVSNSPSPTSPYQAVMNYTPMNLGPFNLIVRAYDRNNTASAPVGITLQAVAEVSTGPAPGTPTSGPTPSNQPPQATPTTVPGVAGEGGCVMNAQFIADITVPDGTTVPLGGSFVKTWRVRNSGTCAWDSSYKLVFAAGNQLNAPGSVPLDSTKPGDVTDVSVPMQAPTTGTGTLAGEWRFASSDNKIFGNKLTVVIALPAPPATPTPRPLPPTATPTPTLAFTADSTTVLRGSCTTLHWNSNNVAGVFLDGVGVASPSDKQVCPTETTTYTLKVDFNDGTSTTRQIVIAVTVPAVMYSFSDTALSARWRNDLNESLPFGGPDTDARGFVMARDGVTMEDNSSPARVLETQSRVSGGGSILGEYDVPITIQAGDKFRARLGFLKTTSAGNVTLRLWFKDVVIGETVKSYDEALKEWTVDLSQFAGQSGKFTLQAINSPNATQAPICWINPRLER